MNGANRLMLPATTRPYEKNQFLQSVMGKVHKLEKFFDFLMSFATLVGFASTAYLVWVFPQHPAEHSL